MIEKRGNRTWYRAVKSYFKLGKKGRVCHVVATLAACLTIAVSSPAMGADGTEVIGGEKTVTQSNGAGDSHSYGLLFTNLWITQYGSITVTDSNAVESNTTYGLGDAAITNEGTITVTNSAGSTAASVSGIYISEIGNDGSVINGETGTITVNNAAGTRAYGINISAGINSTNTVKNSGTITFSNSSSTALVAGMRVDNLGSDASVENAGTIEGESSGGGILHGMTMVVTSGSSVTNSGTIILTGDNISSGTGINAYDSGAAGLSDSQVVNSGSISLSITGQAENLVGIQNLSMGKTINSGTISVSSGTGNSQFSGIYASGEVVNEKSGTITVTAGQRQTVRGIFTKNTNYDITKVSNSGIITVTADTVFNYAAGISGDADVENSGTVTASLTSGVLDDSFYSVKTTGTLANLEGGTLNGRVSAGTTSNAGTINLSSGTSNISGDFTQDATGILGIILDSDSSGNMTHSSLAVSGSATLVNGSGIYVDVKTASENQEILIGKTLSSVITASGGITATTSALNITDNSALLNFTASLSSSDTSLDLNVIKAMSILQAANAGGLGGLSGVGAALDGLSETPNSQISGFISYLNTLSTTGQVAEALGQAAPMTSGSAVSGQLASAMGSVVQARQGGLAGLNSGDGVFSDRNLWVRPFASFMDQKDDNGSRGFTADVFGIGMGADGEISSGDRLGLALFVSRADAETNATPQSSDMDGASLMAYGDRALPAAFTLFWQLGGGIQDTETRRYISGIGSTAEADYTASSLFASVRAIKAFQAEEDLTLTWGPALSYTWLHTPSYTETGAGGMNLAVDGSNPQSLVAALEGGLSRAWTKDVEINATASLGYDLIDDDAAVTSSFQGGGTSFTTQGIDNSPVVFTAGLGVSRQFSDRFSLDADYDMEGRGSDLLTHTLSCKFNWTF